MASSTRTGQQIARKACDCCRVRKKRCRWSQGPSCDECMKADIPCTFDNDQKRRGRPSRHIEAFRRAHSQSINSYTNDEAALHRAPLLGRVTIEHLCPVSTFHQIIDEYMEFIYPIMPVIHRPTFRQLLEGKKYESDPMFLRLCISLCAITIASMPRKTSLDWSEQYEGPKDIISRACQLVLASRLATNPDWAEDPSSDTMICSLLLGLASHYVQCPKRGWTFFNESIHCCRNLNLCRKEGYVGVDAVEAEVCKRAFWMLYMVQVHDRLSHLNPHTPLGQDPVLTEWAFLLPLEVDDEYLIPGDPPLDIAHVPSCSPTGSPTPLISGFGALVKVFLCAMGLLSEPLLNPPSQQANAFVEQEPSLANQFRAVPPTLRGGIVGNRFNHGTLVHILQNLGSVLDDIPEDLRLESASEASNSYQFDIMKANIHITRLYLQSQILECCSTMFHDAPSSWSDTVLHTPHRSAANTELWKSREDIARQLLHVLNFCSRTVLESHGASMVIKIREIAATLLDPDESFVNISKQAQGSKKYVERFIEVLAALDYASQRAATAGATDSLSMSPDGRLVVDRSVLIEND